MCKRRVNPGFQLKFGKGVIALNQKFSQLGVQLHKIESWRTALNFEKIPI
jgi:hypothetical protein